MKDLPDIVYNRPQIAPPSEHPIDFLPILAMVSVLDSFCVAEPNSQVKIAASYVSPAGWQLVSNGFEKLLKNDTSSDILLGSQCEAAQVLLAILRDAVRKAPAPQFEQCDQRALHLLEVRDS